MHDTALDLGKKFFEVYFPRRQPRVLEVGSLNVNGTLRDCAPRRSPYLGVDIMAGPGVDIVLQNSHFLPFKDGRFDATVSSSCFEHAQMFWLTFLEMVRVTKSTGYIYLNAPSNGNYHSYPFDNWRFYPDAGLALAAWAAHQGKRVTLVESFIAGRRDDIWNDCVMVFRKGPFSPRTLPKKKLANAVERSFNVRSYDTNEVVNLTEESEDQQLLSKTKKVLVDREHERDKLKETLEETRGNLASVSATFAQQVTSVAAELTSAKATLAATQEDTARQRSELAAALEAEKLAAAKLLHDLDAARGYLRDSQTEVQWLAGERDGARTDTKQAKAEQQRLAAASAAASRELAGAREDMAKLAAERDGLRQAASQRPALQAQLAALKEALAGAREDSDRSELRLNELSAQLQAATALTDRVRELEARLAETGGEKDRIAGELARAAAALRRAEQNAAERVAVLEAARATALAESETRAQAQLRALRDQLIDAEAGLAKAKSGHNGTAWTPPFSLSRRIARRLATSGLFDAKWYLREYPDVATSGRPPAEHYVEEGCLRGYRPNPFFDTRWYLERYEDVRRAGINPALHYLLHGATEGRDPGPDFHTRYYLEANPDVRGNGMNPLAHYLRHGRHEGRLPAPRR
jgi:hypothetical protein